MFLLSCSVPINGNWTAWSEWVPCKSKISCLLQARYRHRVCSNPIPMYAGKYCEGSNNETAPCENCSAGKKSRNCMGYYSCYYPMFQKYKSSAKKGKLEAKEKFQAICIPCMKLPSRLSTVWSTVKCMKLPSGDWSFHLVYEATITSVNSFKRHLVYEAPSSVWSFHLVYEAPSSLWSYITSVNGMKHHLLYEASSSVWSFHQVYEASI